jgi:hypothetical protein
MSSAESLPNTRDFLLWVNEKWSRKIGAAIGFAYVFVGTPKGASEITALPFTQSFLGFLTPASTPSFLEFVVLFVLAIACAMLKLPRWILDQRNQNEAAIESCTQFRRALVGLTSSWALFYLLIFLWTYSDQSGLKPLIDALNNLQGAFLFACYWILTTRTADADRNQTQAASQKKHPLWGAGPLPLWGLCLFLLWGVFIFLVLDASSVLERPWIQLLSGLWVGAALALVVGCMESPYLAQRIITIPLYFYAALQVAYVEFFQCHPSSQMCSSSQLQTFATLSSLPLKLLFIGLWAWAFDNGLLAFYMRSTRTDLDQATESWKEFSQAGALHHSRWSL